MDVLSDDYGPVCNVVDVAALIVPPVGTLEIFFSKWLTVNRREKACPIVAGVKDVKNVKDVKVSHTIIFVAQSLRVSDLLKPGAGDIKFIFFSLSV